jgi:hypothetical protein
VELLKQELAGFVQRIARFRAAFKREAPFLHTAQVMYFSYFIYDIYTYTAHTLTTP